MYFSSRMQAGRMLAAKITPKYRYENCAVIAMDDGGVMVGAQIAIKLHCIITYLAAEDIKLPREPKAIAGITGSGILTYNNDFSTGEIDELTGEYHNYIEEERIQKIHQLNQLSGKGGLIDPRLLKNMNVILVSDGLDSTMKLDVAYEYIKPISVSSLIVAVPLASVAVIDRIHVMADGVYCLSVVEDYIDTDHYYDRRDIPDHQKIIDTIENIVLHWK